ncbi:SMI1/KNR4 family protein [Gemella bergeri]
MKEFIKKIENLYTAKGATEEQIIAAEKDLNLTFPVEYREYLKEFGAISFYGTELTGLMEPILLPFFLY